VFGGASVLALIARVQHGRGLMFADVEFFGMIALISGYIGRSHIIRCQKIIYARETVGAGLAALLCELRAGVGENWT